MKTIVVIPARLHSTRLPGKVLYPLNGKAMLSWVYEACIKSRADLITVATGDDEVFDYCNSKNMSVIKTVKEHDNGTSRVAEVVNLYNTFSSVINVQADEPLIKTEHINQLIDIMDTTSYDMATLYSDIKLHSEMDSYSVVKVALKQNNEAMYFSRYPISLYKHHGVYAYKKSVLDNLLPLPPTYLEEKEKLEQLRALGYNHTIYCKKIEANLHGVDTYEDVSKVEILLKNK